MGIYLYNRFLRLFFQGHFKTPQRSVFCVEEIVIIFTNGRKEIIIVADEREKTKKTRHYSTIIAYL